MRLTELCLQGYKSFAGRQRFVFPSPITAIVGPNGSGKSNIADARRWALGEQRAGPLRARRGEDLIFAGSERRPRAGLAEVTLLFNNSDGWLSIDASEVAVTRRIHRDGATEYLLNGARIRLRDLVDVLAAVGDAEYTVVSQGMVDSSLSLSPVERRGWIDAAAGIGQLQRKRERALRQLAEAEDNLLRLNDILAELGPQLRRMSRLGERARRHQARSGQLAELLTAWYGFHWQQALSQLQLSRAEAEAAAAARAQAEAEVMACQAELESARQAAERAEAAYAEMVDERERLASGLAALRQEQAVVRTRMEGLRRQMTGADADRLELAKESEALAGRLAALETELARTQAAHREAMADEDAAREALSAAEKDLAELRKAMEAAREALYEATSMVASLHNEQLRLAELERTLTQESDQLAADLAAATRRQTTAEEVVASRREQLAAAERAVATLDEAARRLEARRQRTISALEQARSALDVARGEQHSLLQRERSLRDVTRRLDPSLSWLDQLAETLRAPALGEEILGRIVALLEIDPGWEKAVVAAIGGRLSGLVVAREHTIDRALATLAADAPGPVSLVAVEGQAGEWPAWHPRVGEQTAREIVHCRSDSKLVDRLLGHTAFVEDLSTARAAVARQDGPLQAATRTGALVSRTGVVTIGMPGAHLLALQREAQALPAQLATAQHRLERLAKRVDKLTDLQRRLESEAGELDARRLRAEAERREARQALEQAQIEYERARRESDWLATAAARQQDEREAVGRQLATTSEAIGAAQAKESEATSRWQELESQAAALPLAELRAKLSATMSTTSQLAQRLAGIQAEADAVRGQWQASRERLAQAARRYEDLVAEMAASERAAAAIEQQIARGESELAAQARMTVAAAESRRQAQAAFQTALDRLAIAERTQRTAEVELAEAELAVGRGEERLARLYDQLRTDAEWLHLERALPEAIDPRSPPHLPLPAVSILPPELDVRIARLRQELRAIGAIDHEALEEYETLRTRHQTLACHRADLEAAARDLRRLLGELDEDIRHRFETTFRAVGQAFAEMFRELFGGGEAELVPVVGEDGQAGVDVVARPPGKRRQTLSLLSGGERALTAVALLFALLRVSHTPFVVLDEVDAALDEANIDRFGQALEELSNWTQVIIISHNRGTIQRAGAIYGVTMAEDGSSQVISLKTDGAW